MKEITNDQINEMLSHRPAPSELHLDGKLLAVRTDFYLLVHTELADSIGVDVSGFPQDFGYARFYHEMDPMMNAMNDLLIHAVSHVQNNPEATINLGFDEEDSTRTIGFGEVNSWRKDMLN